MLTLCDITGKAGSLNGTEDSNKALLKRETTAYHSQGLRLPQAIDLRHGLHSVITAEHVMWSFLKRIREDDDVVL